MKQESVNRHQLAIMCSSISLRKMFSAFTIGLKDGKRTSFTNQQIITVSKLSTICIVKLNLQGT
uniref:Uncharacterized protein n=1 Tax=Arundo donax TaxID=35708 RepID=A0A0A9CJJ4_ARUDO